ncbi:dATP/dGTP diphosphohydrolase domain-containing protein [Burkholderia ubonensis]|uniref:dATP/dGTP diphosphohydrolase domain-containing protein n=1 Tax=Burkholderia ubonensis TaxID=101571 RepID=UPI002108CC3A|nr:dATP/dGTP diphosphohydrolase domain-containing protein [Burkholderia ubonensis]
MAWERENPPDISPKNPNPKDSIGSSKVPMHLWPETATVLGALGLLDGALKYGRGNYRASEVRASLYYDALKRHVNGWFSGRTCDPDSGLPDLAHALACLAIIVDAEAAGTLVDDRDYNSGYARLIVDMTPHVKRLQTLHADKAPRHYTIADAA